MRQADLRGCFDRKHVSDEPLLATAYCRARTAAFGGPEQIG